MKWILVVVMVLHGLIHLMGGVNELGLANVKGLTAKTLLPLSDVIQPVLGAVWFIPVILFVAGAVGLVSKQHWWKRITVIALVVSQLLIILWWPDAKFGTLANLIILVGLIFI